MKKPICPQCNSLEGVKLRKTISSNDAVNIHWVCITCKKRNHWESISHKKVSEWASGKSWSIDDIPIWRDYSGRNNCEVCGGNDRVEWHHFMPQSIAKLGIVEDAHLYPTAYLCKFHHDQWHEAVTWYMHNRGNTDIAKKVKEHFKYD